MKTKAKEMEAKQAKEKEMTKAKEVEAKQTKAKDVAKAKEVEAKEAKEKAAKQLERAAVRAVVRAAPPVRLVNDAEMQRGGFANNYSAVAATDVILMIN